THALRGPNIACCVAPTASGGGAAGKLAFAIASPSRRIGAAISHALRKPKEERLRTGLREIVLFSLPITGGNHASSNYFSPGVCRRAGSSSGQGEGVRHRPQRPHSADLQGAGRRGSEIAADGLRIELTGRWSYQGLQFWHHSDRLSDGARSRGQALAAAHN